jgi:hypothetical protein
MSKVREGPKLRQFVRDAQDVLDHIRGWTKARGQGRAQDLSFTWLACSA